MSPPPRQTPAPRVRSQTAAPWAVPAIRRGHNRESSRYERDQNHDANHHLPPSASRTTAASVLCPYGDIRRGPHTLGITSGRTAPDSLADTLSVGLTFGAITYAITFALTERIQRSKSPIEMLNRDRELLRYGISTLNRVMFAALLMLSYIGFSTGASPASPIMKVLAPASAASLAWLLCNIAHMYARSARNISGLDDEDPTWMAYGNGLGATGEKQPKICFKQPTDGPSTVKTCSRAKTVDRCSFPRKWPSDTELSKLKRDYITCSCATVPNKPKPPTAIERIAICLDQMDQLRDLEQRTRRLLTNDGKALRSLIWQ